MDDMLNGTSSDASNSSEVEPFDETSGGNSKQPASSEPSNSSAKDAHKGSAKKDHAKDTAKDSPKDASEDHAKGTAKDYSKDASKDPTKGTAKKHIKGILRDKKVGTSTDATQGAKRSSTKVTFKDPATKDNENIILMTIKGAQEAQTKEEAKATKDDVPMPTMLQPLCPRELLLSKLCTTQLANNNGVKGKISFIIAVATIVICLLGHVIAIPLMSRWGYSEQLRSLQTFDFPHVRTPCAVINNLDTTNGNLTFHNLPYASFTHRFEDSHMVESFQDCYWHYFLNSNKEMTTFKYGVFYWNYEIMMRMHSGRTAWRLQPKRPADAETTGNSELLSLDILTPGLDGSRPVIVLVTGNDLTFNKPVLPSPVVAWRLDAVVVTVNYRLGLDGAAILYRENYMGNLFARDVIQALAWLNHTVHTFGGNAKRMVYLGEGSGATLGMWLMVSPEAVFVDRFWLMDPAVEIPALSNVSTMVEDIFLKEPSPFALKLGPLQIDECYKMFKHRQPASCLVYIALSEVLTITPRWMTEIYRYLDEYPDKANRQTKERSLLHLPPTMLNSSLLSNLRDRRLKLADKPVLFHSSSASDFYWTLFPTGRRNESRFRVETALRESLERMFIGRNSRQVGSAILQQYVSMMKAEVSEDNIDYEEVRRMVLHDIRTMCPVQALIYHLLTQKATTAPIYNLLDLSSYQSVPIVAGTTSMHCNLPRFLVHDFDGACRFAYDVGAEGQRQLRDYRAAAIGILGDFAHGRAQAEHHPHRVMPAAAGHGGDGFDASTNMLDHRGNLPGMDTKRSQLIKSACHELYGPNRDDWNALLYAARFN